MELRDFSPDEAVAAAYQRGELRLGLTDDDNTIAANCISRYADCERAYEELTEAHRKAQQKLFAAMGLPAQGVQSSETGASHHVAWYQDQRSICQDEDKIVVPVAYEVSAHAKNGELCYGKVGPNAPDWKRQPLAIRTHIIHRPIGDAGRGHATRFSGAMSDHILFESDATYVKFNKDETTLEPFEAIEKAAVNELTEIGRSTALQPWVDEFMRLPAGGDAEINLFNNYAGKHFGMGPSDRGSTDMATLLLKPLGEPEAVLNTLVSILGNNNFPALFKLLEQPYEDHNAELAKYPGAPEKSAWLLRNVVAIQDDIQEAIGNHVSIYFHDTFKKRLAIEAIKTERIATLARVLGGLKNITFFAPGQTTAHTTA